MLSTPVQAYLPSFGTRWLFRLWLGLAALIFASGCYWGWQTWRELYRHEEANLLTLSAALATSTHADLHGLQVSLLMLRQQSQDLSGTAPSPLQKLLHQYLRMQPHVAAVGMALANGKIVAAGQEGKTLAGLWQALIHPKTAPADKVQLSVEQRDALHACLLSMKFCVAPPVELKTSKRDSGTWMVPVLQSGAKGRASFLALIPLLQGRLPSWQRLPIQTPGSLFLLQSDGFLEARFPVPTATSFAMPQSGIAVRYLQSHPDLQSGTFVGLSKAAGEWRMGAMVRVPGFPMVAGVGIGYAALWARWWQIFQGTFWGLLALLGLSFAGYRFLQSAERKREVVAQALWESKERAEVTLRSIGDAVIVTDADGRISSANPAAERLLDVRAPQACGQKLSQILAPDEREKGREEFSQSGALRQAELSEGQLGMQSPVLLLDRQGEERWIERSAALIHDQQGVDTGMVWVLRDVTETQQLQEQLYYQATHDALTDLPNRRMFLTRLESYQDRTLYPGNLLVGILDLDGFKQLNDRYGHGFGDTLLQAVAQRLLAWQRENDVVARMGGDEFGLLIPGIQSVEEAENRARAMLNSLRAPLEMAEMTVYLSASLGLSCFPTDKSSPAELLRHADLALYAAKEVGRDTYRFFHEDMDQFQDRSLEICRMTEEALKQGQLVLHYQPIVEAERGPVGVEALIRMHHPQQGLLTPAAFASALDSPRLARRIGQFVFATAFRQNQSWHQQGIHLRVSVNISAHHLLDPAFLSDLQAALDAHPELPPEKIEIEVTETAPLQDFRKAQQVLLSCQQLGVRVALDDFGTGSASLTYLQKLPADSIKIDQSFVRDILHNPKDYAIISGIVTSARLLGLEVIAEGVETWDHAALLHQLQCQCFQGYAIARPMPSDQVENWMKQYNTLFSRDNSTPPPNGIKSYS